MSAAPKIELDVSQQSERLAPISAVSLRDTSVSIGPLLPEDTAALFLWLNDVAAANLDLAYRPVDWMQYKAWIDELGRSTTHTLFAIRKLTLPRIIGFVIFKNIQPVHRSADLGIRIGEESERGKGYGRSAAVLALRYGWNHLNLRRVQLQVFAHNTRAIRAYRAAGFKEEGRLCDAAFIDGQWVDVIPMACLNPETRCLRSAGR
jgi:RimJ/RimL family protein N-acetyltransferase